MRITTSGKRHICAVLGSRTFTEEYVTNKVEPWTKDVKNLAQIAASQPHAACAAYIHGLCGRRSYLVRTTPGIKDLPHENAIQTYLIPALTGQPPCSFIERDLLVLRICLGGLGSSNPSTTSSSCYPSSEHITAPLVALIISQNGNETRTHYQEQSQVRKSPETE